MFKRSYTRTSSIRPLPWLAAMLLGIALSLVVGGGFAAHAQIVAVSPGTPHPPASCFAPPPPDFTPTPDDAPSETDIIVPILDINGHKLGSVALYSCYKQSSMGKYHGSVWTADYRNKPMSVTIRDGSVSIPLVPTTTIDAVEIYTPDSQSIPTNDTRRVCVTGTVLGFSNTACTNAVPPGTVPPQEGKPF